MGLPDRRSLETAWRMKLLDAARDMAAADARIGALNRADHPAADGTYQAAVYAQTEAVRRYRRVLDIFSQLVIDGRVPDEPA